MSRVLVNNLNIRVAPSLTAETVGFYNAGDMIMSGEELIKNEGCVWLKYQYASGKKRYICCIDKDGIKNVEISYTGILGIPKQIKFPDSRIQKYGDCFLCTCVKGGLTTYDQCMDCFNWGMSSGKLRNSDCYVNCNKEEWAKEISSRYGTPYHGDYCFQNNNSGFWLTKEGIVIFNPYGLNLGV